MGERSLRPSVLSAFRQVMKHDPDKSSGRKTPGASSRRDPGGPSRVPRRDDAHRPVARPAGGGALPARRSRPALRSSGQPDRGGLEQVPRLHRQGTLHDRLSPGFHGQRRAHHAEGARFRRRQPGRAHADRPVARRQLARARGLRPDGHQVRGPSRPAPHPDAAQLAESSAAQGCAARRRAGAVLDDLGGRGVRSPSASRSSRRRPCRRCRRNRPTPTST